MRRVHRISVCLIVLLCSSTALGQASGGVDLTFANGYVFRGAFVWEDVFTAHPSATFGWTFDEDVTVSANVWAAVPFHSRTDLKSVRDEVDLTLDTSWAALDDLVVSGGLIVYLLPSADPFFHTEELYAKVAWSMGAGFGLQGGLYGDLNELEGVYFQVGPTWETSITDRVGFSAAAFYGGTSYAATADGEYRSVELGGSVAFSGAVSDSLSATLGGLYNYQLSAEQHVWAITFGTAWSF